jgi:hypothetical protein
MVINFQNEVRYVMTMVRRVLMVCRVWGSGFSMSITTSQHLLARVESDVSPDLSCLIFEVIGKLYGMFQDMPSQW